MKKRILSAILAAVMVLGMIIMPATAAEGKMPFTDVKSGKWYYEAVEYVWKNDLMNGMTATTFEPNTAMNRGMLVTVLWRVEGSPAPKGTTPFTDLKQNYYKKAVAWAYENEIVNGTTKTTFAPENPITREQIATIFYRYAQFAKRDTSAKGDLSKFPDGSKVAKYAKDAMTWAVGEGLISGTKIDGKDYLDPKGNATRAQVATILMRYLESGKDPMVKAFNDFLDEYLCPTHNTLHLTFQYGGDLTIENFGKLLLETMELDTEKYEAIIDEDEFNAAHDEFAGQGDGFSGGGNVTVSIKNKETGEETEAESINIYVKKEVGSGYNCLSFCADDSDLDPEAEHVLEALYCDDASHGDGERFSHIIFNKESDYTEENVKKVILEASGLDDSFEVQLYSFNPDISAGETIEARILRWTGKVIEISHQFFYIPSINDNAKDGGEITKEHQASDPMYGKIDEVLSTIPCVTHGKIDVQFGKSDTLTEENLNAFLTGLFNLGDGYTVAVDSEKFAEIKAKYGGAGNGDTSWEDIDVTFTNTETEEATTETLNLAIRKDTFAYDTGAVASYALTVCPDDLPADILAAREAVSGYSDETIVTIPGTVYSPTVVENWYRETTGLGAGWTFHMAWFSDANPYEGNEVLLVLKNENVNDEGRTYTVGCNVVLRIEPDAVDPMYEKIENVLTDISCTAHTKIDVQFGKSDTFTEENMNAFLAGLFNLGAGYSVTVDSAQFAEIKEGYGGAGNGDTSWKDIDVTFTNTETEETTTETLNLAIRKDTFAKYSEAVESYALTVCPDELPDDIVAAKNAVSGYNDETLVTLDGKDFTPEVIEAWYREVTGLNEGWEFFLAWFNADDQYTGNDVICSLKNVNVNDEGRTYVVSCEVVLNINVPPADPPAFTDIDYDVSEAKQGALINNEADFTAWVLEYIKTRFEFPQDSIEIRNYSDLKAAYDAMIAAGTYSAASTINLTYHSSDASAPAIDATYDFYFVGGPYEEATGGDGPVLPAMTCDIQFDVKKVDSANVVKDGVISEGEYYRCLAPKAELFGAKTMTGDKLAKYQQMVDTSKFYFSWDEEHGFNIAVEMIAPDLLQLNSADVFDGRLEPKEGDDPDNFKGPCDGFMDQLAFVFQGVADASGAHGFYYAFGRNTETGEYLRGHWFGSLVDGLPQYGYDASYYPVEDQDMVISYGPGNKVVFEYSLPLTTLFPAEMINSDGTIVNGSKYNYNMVITDGWNETTHTIANAASDYNAEMVPLKFGDLGAWLDWRQGKWNGKTVKKFNRPAVLTFINEG